MAAGGLILGATAYRNWTLAGEFTLAQNSAYNLYLGNQDVYAEDLNLLSPRATRSRWSSAGVSGAARSIGC